MFQWGNIRTKLDHLDSMQNRSVDWGVMQNYRNMNGVVPVAKGAVPNGYKSMNDRYGVDKYQSVPLYSRDDLQTPERYGQDGGLVKIIGDTADYIKVETLEFGGQWIVPKKFIKKIDQVAFSKVIVVDKTNQNITTIEKVEDIWLVRSMNPATTGLHAPPYKRETPTGVFVIQKKLEQMVYLEDGTGRAGGFAPYASRFSCGAYIHGIPVNRPSKKIVEYSPTLGTTPRSHKCVRNASSHALFVYDWAPIFETVVYVID